MDESSSSTFNQININSNYYLRKKFFRIKKKDLFKKVEIKIISLDSYFYDNNLNKIDFLKIDTEGFEFEILLGLQKYKNINFILFEHHYDDMIKKKYKFKDINHLLILNNFKLIYKAKMPLERVLNIFLVKKGYMKASVIIANFNGEKYIDQCIQSLQNQIFKDFEIIFFDDCSTDNSLKIVNKYKNIKIIENKNHSSIGAFNQINAYKSAFQNSTGDIIFTLDSDDYFYPEISNW